MDAMLKATLIECLQNWLDDYADKIVCIHGVYQDDTDTLGTAVSLAAGAEAVFVGMIHQKEMIERYSE